MRPSLQPYVCAHVRLQPYVCAHVRLQPYVCAHVLLQVLLVPYADGPLLADLLRSSVLLLAHKYPKVRHP